MKKEKEKKRKEKKDYCPGTGEIAQWLTLPFAKPEGLSSVHGTHAVEEHQFCPLTSVCMLWHT